MTLLDSVNLGRLWLQSYPRERYRWGKIIPRDDEPAVYYGFDRIGTADDHVFGGVVKLQDLQKIYPNESSNPNILYLISSALPHFAVRMAKMAKKAGLKLVINQNGVAYPGWYGPGWEQCNRPMRELHKMADFIFYQSKFCKMSADKFVGDYCPKWEIAYNPVDTKVFCPGDESQSRKKGRTMLLAGSHGNFYRPQAAIQTLRLVLEHATDVSLVIAGRFTWHRNSKHAEAEVMECARREGVQDRVRFLGPYSQREAVGLLRSADMLIHTKYNDPCPRLVIEALACGVPVLYSATGGVVELVQDRGGYGIPGPQDWEKDHPPSPELMAKGALDILENSQTYREGARQLAVERFDVEPWLAQHKRIFTQIVM